MGVVEFPWRGQDPMDGALTASRHGAGGGEDGLGMLGLVASLAILAVMALIAVTSLNGLPTTKAGKGDSPVEVLPGGQVAIGNSGATGGAGNAVAGAPSGLVAQTGDTVAQTNLTSALSAVDQAALSAGGYGDVTVASLAAESRGDPFTSGPSTTTGQMSLVAAGGASGGVTLAVHSASGTCWFVWRSNAVTWYGAQTGHSACQAPALPSAPAASHVSNGSIGWQSGSFPGS